MSASSTRQSEDTVRFTLRVPEDLHTRLRLIARDSRRSLNAEVVVALENHARHRESDNDLEAAA